MIRILLVDDNAQFRSVLRRLLERQPDLTVIDEAANGLDAVELAERLRPDVVLMDVSMPRMDGVAATRLIGERAPRSAVILLSIGNKPQEVAAGLAGGASEYLAKGVGIDRIVAAVRAHAPSHAG